MLKKVLTILYYIIKLLKSDEKKSTLPHFYREPGC